MATRVLRSLALLLAGCGRTQIRVHPVEPVTPAAVAYGSFAEAVDDLDADAALRLAADPDQAAYAAALGTFVQARWPESVDALAGLVESRDDAIKTRARELHTMALIQTEAWDRLAASSDEPTVQPVAAALAGQPAMRTVLPAAGARVPVGFSYAGSPLIEVGIGAHSEQWWIDTGATFSVLSSDAASQGHVALIGGPVRATVGASGAGKDIMARVGLIEHVRIGALESEFVPAAILEPSDMRLRVLFVTLFEVRGILGWNVLKRTDVDLDYPGATATFWPPEAASAERNLLWFGHPLAVASTTDGRHLHLLIDTGASRSYLTPRGASKLPGRHGPPPAAGDRLADVTFVLAGHAIEFSTLRVDTLRGGAWLDGVLANDVFRHGTLRLQATAGRMTFTPGASAQ